MHLVHLYSLYNLGLAIADAIIASQNKGAKDGCGSTVWGCVVMCCVVRFVIGGVHSTKIQRRLRNREEGDESMRTYVVQSFGPSLFWIWTLIVFHGTTGDCLSYYKTNFPDLWTMITIEAITFYVTLGLVCCGSAAHVRVQTVNGESIV